MRRLSDKQIIIINTYIDSLHMVNDFLDEENRQSSKIEHELNRLDDNWGVVVCKRETNTYWKKRSFLACEYDTDRVLFISGDNIYTQSSNDSKAIFEHIKLMLRLIT